MTTKATITLPATLDGLGGVGGGAHTAAEHVDVARMVPRTHLLAELITQVNRQPDRGT